MNDTLYGNKRSELHDRLLRWLQSDVSMPNDKSLSEEFAAYKWGTGGCRRDDKNRLFMTPKANVHKDIGRSPDRLDACAVAMAIDS